MKEYLNNEEIINLINQINSFDVKNNDSIEITKLKRKKIYEYENMILEKEGYAVYIIGLKSGKRNANIKKVTCPYCKKTSEYYLYPKNRKINFCQCCGHPYHNQIPQDHRKVLISIHIYSNI